MAQKNKGNACCASGGIGCCRVEALVGVDERGQMVLPKGIRDRLGIRAGDRLAVIVMEKDGKACCLSLIKAEDLDAMVRDLLGPVLGEVFQK